MQQYLDLLRHVLTHGKPKADRTGTGTVATFGYQFRHDLSKGFPLLTTKKIPFHLIVSELLWFIRGDTNTKFLHEHRNTIWDEWQDANGDLGPIYGAQWRKWRFVRGNADCSIDQLRVAIDTIRTNPDSRRIIVTAWNPAELPDMALPPCHLLYQFQVHDGRLSCGMYQRSADSFLGVPFNIASYALLTHMVAHVTGLQVGDLIISFGDLHLYNNHLPQADLQLARLPGRLPRLILNQGVTDLFAFTPDDIGLLDYTPQAHIPAAVSK